jgi:hypothetical protein
MVSYLTFWLCGFVCATAVATVMQIQIIEQKISNPAFFFIIIIFYAVKLTRMEDALQ